MKLNKLTTAFVVFATIGALSLPVSTAFAAPDAAKIAERKARKSQAVGEKVGRAIGKAWELYGQEKVNEAIASLLEVKPTADYDKAFYNRFLGQLYVEKDQAKALGLLIEAAKPDVLSFTDQAAMLRTIADLSTGMKKYQQAIEYYNKWLDFTGEESAEVYFRIAYSYYELKQFDKVIPAADKAIAKNATPKKEPYQLKFASYYEKKDYKKAIEVLETLVVIFPDSPKEWVQLGSFYAMVEDYEKSLAVLSMAYKQGFLKTEAEIKTLANLYLNNNVPHRAASILEKHLKAGLLKKDRNVLSSIASAYNNARDFKKAANFYGELAKLENDGESYRRQGIALYMAGQSEPAISALNKALEVGVKDKGAVHIVLMEAYFYQSKLRDAYRHNQLARDNGQARAANNWAGYIRERAEKRGVSL